MASILTQFPHENRRKYYIFILANNFEMCVISILKWMVHLDVPSGCIMSGSCKITQGKVWLQYVLSPGYFNILRI